MDVKFNVSRLRICWVMYMVGYLSSMLWAQSYPSNASEVYHSVLRLEKQKVEEALSFWEEYPVAQSHLANYMIFFELFIHENANDYEKYYPRKEEFLTRIREGGDPTSPFYLYAQADIHLQWAMVEAKFRDYFHAFRDVKRAYSLLEENHKRFPEFLPNKKNMGVMIALAGTIPEKYQWGFEWISGIPADLDLGKNWLKEATEADHLFRDEAIAMYGFMLIHVLGKEEQGWAQLKEISIPAHENPLLTFLLSNLALDLKKLDEAEALLEDFKRQQGQLQLPQLDYYRGLLYAYKGKFEKANTSFEDFLEEFNGLHLVKSAWLHKAYGHYIMGEENNYLSAMEACRSEGDDLLDEDAHALSIAEKGELLPVPVLKVVLFFDGGNYKNAQELINSSLVKYQEERYQKILRYYQARIHHETGDFANAISVYLKVMQMPHPEHGHYAANSALQIGDILKERGKCDKARYYFKYCVDLKAESYDNSLDQKAKVGLMQCQ